MIGCYVKIEKYEVVVWGLMKEAGIVKETRTGGMRLGMCGD